MKARDLPGINVGFVLGDRSDHAALVDAGLMRDFMPTGNWLWHKVALDFDSVSRWAGDATAAR